MNYLHFSTHFEITSNVAKLYLLVYACYLGCRNYYNLQTGETQIFRSTRLKFLSENKDSENTAKCLLEAETEVHNFLHDWSTILYQMSSSFQEGTISKQQIRILHFFQQAFFDLYFVAIRQETQTFRFGEPFFNLSDEFLGFQDCLLMIYENFEKMCEDLDSLNPKDNHTRMETLLNVLIELKLISSIFTQIKKKIMNDMYPRPTSYQ